MPKKIYIQFFIPVLLCFILHTVVFTQTNLIKNPGFEEGTDKFPSYWSSNIWNDIPEAAEVIWEESEAYEGTRCISLINKQPNDARLIQVVPVTPGTGYKVSCMARVLDTGTETAGANISVVEQLLISDDLRGDSDEWQKLEVYIRTESGINTITLCLSLGGYSNLNTGKAMFDAVSMIEAPIPADARVITIAHPKPRPAQEAGEVDNEKSNTPEKQGKTGVETLLLLIFFGLLFILVILFLVFKKQPAATGPSTPEETPPEIPNESDQAETPAPLPPGEEDEIIEELSFEIEEEQE